LPNKKDTKNRSTSDFPPKPCL